MVTHTCNSRYKKQKQEDAKFKVSNTARPCLKKNVRLVSKLTVIKMGLTQQELQVYILSSFDEYVVSLFSV